jgi:putative acetyltransferase
MEIRPEQEKDWPSVYDLNVSAFDTKAEANLVNSLREIISPIISIVATIDGVVVGHILFTPVELSQNADTFIMGLAPMAVTEKQRVKGIGGAMVASGIKECKQLGAGAVVVLGHSSYYPKFGFKAASRFNIACEYDVPDEAFMVLELLPEYLSSKSGVIRYHELFASV